MNRFLPILAGLILISNYAFSQFTLKIEITDFRNNKGKVILQFFDSNEKILTQEMSDIKDNRSLFIINNLKAGKYAVRYYHDENLNQVMETNMLGSRLKVMASRIMLPAGLDLRLLKNGSSIFRGTKLLS